MRAGTANAVRLARVPGVELFAAGTRGGKEYTPRDLDDIAANGRRWGHLIRPTVKLGHGELQQIAGALTPAEATGDPKLGSVDWRTLRTAWGECPACETSGTVDGQKCPECGGKGWLKLVKGDLYEVHPAVADLIRRRAYDRQSAEIYDRPPEGVPGKGKMLRALSILGGTQPVVKSLKPLPEPVDGSAAPALVRMSEVRQLPDGCFEVFSEVRRVPLHEGTSDATRGANIAEMIRAGHDPKQAEAAAYRQQREAQGHMRHEHIRKLAEMGADPAILNEMPDHHLAHMAEVMGGPDLDGEPPDVAPDQMAMHAEKFHKMRHYAEKGCKKYGEPGKPPAVTDPANPQDAVKFSEQVVAAAKAEILKQLGATAQTVKDLQHSTDRAALQLFCEGLRDQGKLDPAALDAGPEGTWPTVVDQLLKLDATPVHKFSEGGKTVLKSERDFAKARLASAPARKLGDYVPAGKGQSQDYEKAKVEAHYDSFAETFAALHTSRDEFVGAFDEARKLDPSTTAEKYLNVRTR